MKLGDLVYAASDSFDGCGPAERGLGVVAAIEARGHPTDFFGEHVYRVFWLDEDEPAWYYEHEVESVDEAR